MIQMITPRAASDMMVQTRQMIFLGRVRKHQQRLRGAAARQPTGDASLSASSCIGVKDDITRKEDGVEFGWQRRLLQR
jgi:hypothetical protein